MTVEELFARPLAQWGLRGDVHVWRAMGELLAGRPVPGDFLSARRMFEEAFLTLTGLTVDDRPGLADVVHLESFSTGSGISDGSVMRSFWRRTAIPILVDRAMAAAA